MEIIANEQQTSPKSMMTFLIALLASFVSLYQNKVMLMFGLKEGAIFFAPFRFGLFFFVELGVIWISLVALMALIKNKNRRALLMLLVSVGIIGACETVMPDSTLKWDHRDHEKTSVLRQITVEATKFEKLPEGGFVMTYTLKFPKDAHYLTFPAYVGRPDLNLFGKYDYAETPEYYDETYVFTAGKPYDFIVKFPGATNISYKNDKAHIQICDGKGYDMSCHTIQIGVEGAENAPVRAK
jgi:hypothetical protein